MEAKVYDNKGKESGKVKLPSAIFELPWNADLVHQVAVSYLSNQRQGTAHAKDRSEVSGTGKKPWKQKGTGRARHGDRQSPIWIGGGVAHGPKAEKNYKKKINKKMKNKALFTALSKKYKDGNILFVDNLDIKEMKTKTAAEILKGLSKVSGFDRLSGSNKVVAHIAAKETGENVVKSFNNIPHVEVDEISKLNILDVLNRKYLIIVSPEESLKTLESRIK